MHRRQESRLAIRPSKHTGESKKPVCGDSRHDLNYSEIPTSWNNKEKTTMNNFNEKINSHKCEVEKMNEKVEKLERQLHVGVCVTR